MREQAEKPQTLFPVALASLEPGSIVPCDLWLRHGEGEALLYRSRQLPFTLEHRERLMGMNVETVWVAFEDAALWSQYTEERLRRRVSDPDVPLNDRAKILVEASRPIMKDVLTNPREPHTESRVTNLAGSVCELIRGPEAFAATVRLMEHDYYTYTHSLHVAIYSVALAGAVGVDDADVLMGIGRGTLMHDCGKVALPAYLLNKPGRLDEGEWDLMRTHPLRGVEVLEETGWQDRVVYDICLNHHERMNGSGYPRSVQGDEIPVAARITAIADAYDAMTTDRAYHRAMRGSEALWIIRRQCADHYDQELVERFIRSLIVPLGV
ncbi:MAG: HD-GYP domain-containing protein [Acidobacteria bacterium]|nr:HD-GYP domain-containing protein [Acidobacteriota bacterium]